MVSAIEIINLVKKFGDITAVDDLTFTVAKGEIFGLLGPNGAGKSTTINILTGLLEPTGGSAMVGGFDVVNDSGKVHGIIGLCPQETSYFKYLTGRENIELFGNLHGMPKDILRNRVNMLLEKIGLTEVSDRKTGQYSGGMVRRVNLAMALIHDPEIAFLDEPTVAMDPQSRRATWEFIEEQKRNGKTVILTTHYIEEAEALADRVGIIDHGKLIALDIPKVLMDEHGAEDLEQVFIELTGRKIREAV